MHLYETLATRVAEWRNHHYPSEQYPAISEILEWASNPDVPGFQLRAPQLRALETYWYLRLVQNTPHIFDLYTSLFDPDDDPDSLFASLGVPEDAFKKSKYQFNKLWKSIRTDDAFVKEFHLEALRETLTLEYPSYILALAMGAGKTVLIGAIYATEFAMALEYPEGNFVENALVFAPGKTIIESLRELAEMRYESVIPPRLYKIFAASLKLTFTRDGDPTIPITPGSSFNVVVTNTEKIRIQKESILKSALGPLFSHENEDQARTEIANLRLQAIASLPKLAIFSDEAHHTYGQALDQELKKVRKTVDYLYNPFPVGTPEHDSHTSRLVCVVNTTGTPYFQHQPLRDVVIWYGLSEGIRDGILKELAGNIQGFNFDGNVEEYLTYVVQDFFKDYQDVSLLDGTPAKLAIFFPQTDDLQNLRPVIEAALSKLGLPQTLILEHHTKNDNKADFDRFKSKDSPHRIALLVDRGVEGWNVPALFACALARKLKSSNNFVLQAASRCLRQVAGNTKPARIYLSNDNKNILDKQLQETYGESFAQITGMQAKSRTWTITLQKVNVPPLVIQKKVRSVQPVERVEQSLCLELPQVESKPRLEKVTYSVDVIPGSQNVLQQQGDKEVIVSEAPMVGLYSAAVLLASNYHLPAIQVLQELKRLYAGMNELPIDHLPSLSRQIEEQTRKYEVIEETVEVALALVKPDGFTHSVDDQGVDTYTATISYPVDKEELLTHLRDWQQLTANGYGFHYSPYNFDSKPERNFFSLLLQYLNLQATEVDDILFTGGITDPQKTDFFVEYLGDDGAWHRYTPDFILRRKDGKCLIVEIKKEHDRAHPVDGEYGQKAVATRKWVDLNPNHLKYEMIFVDGEEVSFDKIAIARQFISKK